MRIHFIQGEKSNIAFFPDTLEIRKVTLEERIALEKQIEPVIYPEMKVEENSDYFSTLILHVANTCNMKCAYCFANHGSYGSDEGVMSEETALEAVDIYYGKYKRIKQIKFFGGEPFMNLPTMDAVCRHIEHKYLQGHIDALPEYKVVTNGTIMPQVAMELIKKYDIQVVFSMDGPEMIHDHARVFVNGKGTYQTIKNNFQALRTYTEGKQPYGVELTYTAVHRKNGLLMKDVTDFFVREFEIDAKNVNISPVSADEDSEYALKDHNHCMVDSAKEIMRALKLGEEAALDQKLYFLIKKIKSGVKSDRQICNAAWKWAAVSSKGDVFPCLMFVDREDYKLGNINNHLFEDERYKKITEEWKHYDRFSKASCANCFANNICINCMGHNMDSSGSVYDKTPQQCAAMRHLMEVMIEGIAEGVF